MSKILLFDFDGTIADSFESFLEIMKQLSIKYNFQMLPREELEKLRSEDAKNLIRTLKVPFYKIPFMGVDMKKMQQQSMKDIKPFPTLPDVLHKLKSKEYTLGILTSNGKANVELFIKQNNIDVFDYIYSDSSIFGKDKVISNFLKQNKITKEQVMYVGDEIRDIQACQKVGIKMVAVTWGFNSKEGLLKYHPDFIIDIPEELLKVAI